MPFRFPEVSGLNLDTDIHYSVRDFVVWALKVPLGMRLDSLESHSGHTFTKCVITALRD